MLVAAGNINQPYEVIGIVHAVVSREYTEKSIGRSYGCGGPDISGGHLPISEAYAGADAALAEAAAASGGDGVIHIGYHFNRGEKFRRYGCADNRKVPVHEVYAWGTAIKLL